MKKIVSRVLYSFPIGISCSVGISLLLSLIFGEGKYYALRDTGQCLWRNEFYMGNREMEYFKTNRGILSLGIYSDDGNQLSSLLDGTQS